MKTFLFGNCPPLSTRRKRINAMGFTVSFANDPFTMTLKLISQRIHRSTVSFAWWGFLISLLHIHPFCIASFLKIILATCIRQEEKYSRVNSVLLANFQKEAGLVVLNNVPFVSIFESPCKSLPIQAPWFSIYLTGLQRVHLETECD